MSVKIVQKSKSKVFETPVSSLETFLIWKIPEVKDAQERLQKAKKQLTKAKAFWDKVTGPVIHEVGQQVAPEEGVTVTNDEGLQLVVSKESVKREVLDVEKAFHFLEEIDPSLPWKLLRFNLTDLDKYLTPEQLEKVVAASFSGKRTVKVK